MPVRFNHLLTEAGLDPSEVRLVRHQDKRSDHDRTPYQLWSQHPDDFVEYQSRQDLRSENGMGRSRFWAVFVVTTTAKETLFAGIYSVDSREHVSGAIVKSVNVRGEIEAEHIRYSLSLSDYLAEFIGKVVID